MQDRSPKMSSIAGFIAGCSTWLLFPLDKMKIHMIVSEKSSRNYVPYYPSNLSLFKSMWSKGFRYMYRGVHFQLSTSFAWAVYFSIYEPMKRLPSKQFRESHYELYKFSVAAGSAILGNFISNPLFVMKTRALLTPHSETWFRDSLESLVKTWKVDGIRGYWRGYSVGLLLSFDGTLTMYLYETFKEHLPIKNDSWRSSAAGGISKVIACSFFFPIVSMKMRLQQEQYRGTIPIKAKDVGRDKGELLFKGVIDCARDTLKTQGILGFYRGLSMTLIKVFPTSALFFGVYEMSYRILTIGNKRIYD